MSGNTESSSNTIKFAPVPMSALLANLMSHQTDDTPDSSYTTEDSDSSFNELVSKNSDLKTKINSNSTPQYKIPKSITSFPCERQSSHKDDNKENNDDSLQERRNKESQSACQPPKSYLSPITDQSNKKQKSNLVLLPLTSTNSKISLSKLDPPAFKNTPDVKSHSMRKTKIVTPVIIKCGIRKFTPSSAKHSQKKTPLLEVLHNRDKVRCELFGKRQQNDPPPPDLPSISIPASVPVPETPVNRKPMPASYIATPSYPQGVIVNNGPNNSKILFKTTIIKDKKYMFIKKLGIGGSSEVFKVIFAAEITWKILIII